MGSQPESRLSRKIMEELRDNGVFCWKNHGGPTMMAGLPDIIACVDGLLVGFETKLPHERDNVSEKQLRVHEQIRESWGLVWIVCSPAEALHWVTEIRRLLPKSKLRAMSNSLNQDIRFLYG